MTATLEELEARVIALERADYRLILSRVSLLESKLDGVEAGMHARFNAIDERFDKLETNMNTRFDELEANMNTQYAALMTAIGTVGGTLPSHSRE